MKTMLRNTRRGLAGLALLATSFGIGRCVNSYPEITYKNNEIPEMGRPNESEFNSARLARLDKVTRYLKLKNPYDISHNSRRNKPEVESEADFESIKRVVPTEDEGQVKTIGITQGVDFGGDGIVHFQVGYNGMIGKDTFVLSGSCSSVPNFYPADRKQIEFYGHRFFVKDVNSDLIKLDHSQCPLREK